MPFEVRTATARDRKALRQFYSREGISFESIASRAATVPMGRSSETMFIIAASEDMICAAMKLDIGENSEIGKIGFIQHFEIEDELEASDMGDKMLKEATRIAEEKNLKALDTIVSEDRPEIIRLFGDADFQTDHREVYLRREFRNRIF